MARFLQAVGAFSARRRWWVIIAWVVILAAAIMSMATLSKSLDSNITIKGLQSITTLDEVQQTFGGADASGRVVFAAPSGQKFTAADEQTVASLTSKLEGVNGVTSAVNPFLHPTAGALSPDGRIGYVAVQLNSAKPSTTTENAIRSVVNGTNSKTLQVVADSSIAGDTSASSSQLPGIILALIVLLVTFGTLIPAGMPLLVSLIGLGTSVTAIYAATSFVSLTSVAPTLALLLGLAVGIDYSLFIVSRHRRQVADGMNPKESVPLAVGTAGSAVFFAAVTVIIALAGLAVENLGFLTQMGLAAAFAVLMAMLVSLTLTPALLSLAGKRVLTKRARRRLAEGVKKHPSRMAHGWVTAVQKQPVLFLVASLVVVGVLAVPLTGLRLGLGSDSTQPSATMERQAADLLADGFGAGINGPVEVLASYPSTPSRTEEAGLVKTVTAVPDVAEAVPSGVKGEQMLLTVIPKGGPSDDSTTTLVNRLREDSLATSLPGSPSISVTGQTAVDIDISARLASALPLYLGLIALFAFLLMILVFRSILVPLKAALSFLLTLGASLGVTVAVFQWGWLGSLFGVDPASPLLAFLPTIVIGVLFGLSMDYEMFLVTGMRERFAHGEKARSAVSSGFQQGAKVVAAAALIMIGVFGNGDINGDSTVRPIAFALAIGIIVDAFIIRMTLVPAVMTLFGRAAWWIPRWLNRIVPDIDIEGKKLERGAEPALPVAAASDTSASDTNAPRATPASAIPLTVPPAPADA